MTVFSLDTNRSHLDKNLFLDEMTSVARYDEVKYSSLSKLMDKQWSFFWRPEEVDIARDSKDFKLLTDQEKHIFTSNLKRQILLDSVQGRAPSLAFLPICSLPELETWINTWTFFETIHSLSYTHIIRNIYSNPSVVFDSILESEEIVDCAKDISKYYDELINMNTLLHVHSNRPWYRRFWSWLTNDNSYRKYDHKKAIWLCLNAVNALEGIRFYASFACSWNFAEQKKMEGNAKIIKFIARDENLHLAVTQQILKMLVREDSDFVKISEECYDEVYQIWEDVLNQEKNWGRYIFKNGSMIGLNSALINEYLDWLASKRMNAIGIKPRFKFPSSNPLPWTQKWIAGSDVQTAPQEVEISSYTIGKVKKDVDTSSFGGFSL